MTVMVILKTLGCTVCKARKTVVGSVAVSQLLLGDHRSVRMQAQG